MIDWSWTWQDPVAIIAAAATISFALWLRRRLRGGHRGGCEACPKHRS